MQITPLTHTPLVRPPLDGKPLQLSPDEQQELDQYTDRLRPELGQLQTPPIGPSQPGREDLKNYAESLLLEVAGKDFKARGLNVRLEVFSGDVPQAGVDDDGWQELDWQDAHPGETWPIRAWYGIPKDGKPIYRLTLNLGLVKNLETREELAFVLAQQASILLTHDQQDPLNNEFISPERKNYLEPHKMQAGADRVGIQRMADAGYNPKGAFDALTRLYSKFAPEYPKKDLDRGLTAAAQGQEHEGLRMALVQTEVERLKRSGHPSAAKPLTPLPANLSIEAPPLYQKDTQDFAHFASNVESLADQLGADPAPPWMFGEGPPPQAQRELWSTRASDADWEKALVQTCAHLQNEQKPAQEKVAGFLRLLLTVQDGLRPLSEAGAAGIEAFLDANQAGFDAERFTQGLFGQGKTLHHDFAANVVLTEPFQKMLPESYHELIARVPSMWTIDTKTLQPDPQALPELLKQNHKDKPSGWPLAGAIDDAILAHLKGLDGQALANQTADFGLPAGLVLANHLLDVDNLSPDFHLRLDRALDTIQAPSAATREVLAQSKLRAPFPDPASVDGFLVGLFKSEGWTPFSSAFEQQLPGLLLDQARACSGVSDQIFGDDRPQGIPASLERRYCELLSQDRTAILRQLERHWVHEQRVSQHSQRREWTVPLARSLSKDELLAPPDLSQHANLLRRTYLDGYQLQDSALPDTTTASLKALDERRENREFEPKAEDYASDDEYWKAVDAYWARCDQMEKAVDFLAPMESRLVLGKLALLGHDEQASAAMAASLTLDEYKRVLDGAHEAQDRSELEMSLTDRGGNERVGVDVGGFLLDGFLAVQSKVDDVKTWYEMCDRTLSMASGTLESRVGSRRKLGDNFFPRLDALPADQIPFWLNHSRTLDLLSPAQASQLLMKVATSDDPGELRAQVDQLDHDYKLREDYPLVFRQFRDDVTQRAKLQPATVDKVFPPQDDTDVDQLGPFKKQARGLSGLVAMTRNRPPVEQLETIEYLLGRSKNMPAFLEEAGEAQNYAPLVESLRTTREELADADSNTRVLVANSFLAGPSGILRTEEGKEAVLQHFMKGIEQSHLELAKKVANAVLHSQGDADTLAVAYILGQKPKPGQEGKMDEAAILNRLFDAYGVPGIKMKQYLAFTSEFSAYKEAFESAQDAALPLNYFQVLKLVQTRFGDNWPADLKIDRVLGSGSVNVAIRYTNAEGKGEVVSLGREHIEEQTKYDFDRFEKFIAELTATPEDKERFGYVTGLLDVIHKSVALEFEKEAVKEVQKQAYETYNQKYKGWTVRSIDAYRVENLGLFMEEAKGKTARKISEKDPALYKEAMKPMARAEMGVLRGQDSSGNLRPKKLFANPDFHDGQVLVDAANKTVTILDFGQAVPIDNQQRKTALDLLTVIGKADSLKTAAKRMNRRFFEGRSVVQPEDLDSILKRKARMDIFVHLLSLLNQKGADVPISSVHWILGLNRQIALGERLGQDIHGEIKHMVINHKMGLPLAVYNTAHAVKEKLTQWATAIAGSLGGWGVPGPEDEAEDKKPEESWAWHPEDDFKSLGETPTKPKER